MATVICDTVLDVDAERAWTILRDFGAADRAFPGILVGCRREADMRTVEFANGTIVRERLVTLDDSRRRIAYAVVGGRFSHHSASMQVVAEGPNRSRFLWISDFLPDEAEPIVRGLMEQGSQAFRKVAETGATGGAGS